MTPAQKTALEAVAGRALTAAEEAAIDAHLPERNDSAIAQIINDGTPAALQSIPVQDVFDVLFYTGDYMTLKTAQLAGNAVAAMAFAVLQDAKELGSGMVNLALASTVALFDQLEGAALLTAAGRAALTAHATRKPPPVGVGAVSNALNEVS